MTNEFIQPANRIATFKPYFFASLNQNIASLKSSGMDIIRIDIGSPDLPPNQFIIDKLNQSANRPDTHGYTPNGGTPEFRKAIASYYQKRFNVPLDPQKEVITLLGSKEGLFNLSQVLINPGETILVPDPGYPVYKASGIIAGGVIYPLPLIKENHFLPDLDAIPTEVAQKAKLIWINYPNNPIGAVAPYEFFEKIVSFAKKFEIIIAHDAPYTDVSFDNYIAPSIMQVPGAKDIAVEFNSLSKTYNMAGGRLGMAVGNAKVISYLNTYKSQMDSSHFQPILEAGIEALTGDQSWLSERNLIYQKRRDIILKSLHEAGIKADTPPASIYIWAQVPESFPNSIQFCERMLKEAGVSTTPGSVYGDYGEGYFRISLGAATEKIEEAMIRIKKWLI